MLLVLFTCDVTEVVSQALNMGATEEGDPFISCVFKTELVTHLLRLTQGSINVLIGPTWVLFSIVNIDGADNSQYRIH